VSPQHKEKGYINLCRIFRAPVCLKGDFCCWITVALEVIIIIFLSSPNALFWAHRVFWGWETSWKHNEEYGKRSHVALVPNHVRFVVSFFQVMKGWMIPIWTDFKVHIHVRFFLEDSVTVDVFFGTVYMFFHAASTFLLWRVCAHLFWFFSCVTWRQNKFVENQPIREPLFKIKTNCQFRHN